MQVEALDHVNIITAYVDRAAGFYADVLGLEARDGPPPLTHATARWKCMTRAGGWWCTSTASTRRAPFRATFAPARRERSITWRCAAWAMTGWWSGWRVAG